MKGEKIVILTGAGISAESRLGTFRDKDGLWTQYDLEDVATPQGYARNPAMVHEFYNARRANCLDAAPNAAHMALARLEAAWDGGLMLVTQNVDDLHERGGSRDVIHMHGELLRALCSACGARWDAPREMSVDTACPSCGANAARPDVVWFGEFPYNMHRIEAQLSQADLFVAIGTSGEVYPAADFVDIARRAGARSLEFTLEPSGRFDEVQIGPATETVPAWVDALLR